jgi:hypothetical protein
VFRRLYADGEKKDNFPNCTKKKLPSGEPEWPDYWVTFDDKNLLDDFVKFDCQSLDNSYLTIDYLFWLLERYSKKNLNESEYSISLGDFRKKSISFVLDDFIEGKQVVWLEPYLLRKEGKYGFLLDFKFTMFKEQSFTKRIQQLSLSLDRNGRSNTNFYSDRYEKIQRFLHKFHSRLFSFEEAEIRVEKRLQNIVSSRLKPKNYVFANGETAKSQFMGVKNNGPLKASSPNVKVYFVFREEDRSYSHDLYRALRGDSFPSTFPGMKTMFGYDLSRENVSGATIADFSIPELQKVISNIRKDSGENPVVPLLITPFSKDDYDEEASAKYYLAKHTFLKHHIPSQFVSLKRLQKKEELKWAISNIGLQLFAKMGGQPWKVTPQTNKCLIVGLGQSHKYHNDKIEKYFAYSVLTDSSGLYKDLKVLGNSEDQDSYLASFRKNLQEVITNYYHEYQSFVIHTTFSLQKNELDILNSVLGDLASKNRNLKEFVVMRFNEHSKYFGYSLLNNSMVPYESSFIQLSDSEYLIWFEGLQYHNPTVRKRIDRPIYIEFYYTSRKLDIQQKEEFLQDAVNLSGANWRGFNAKSKPVSVYYAHLVARYYNEFQSLELEDIDLEKITPWFL